MASYGERWIIVEQKEIYLNWICFKLPRKMDVHSLQRQTLPHCLDFLARSVWTVLTWAFYYYFLEWKWACDLDFFGISLKIWSEQSILEVNIIRCKPMWATLHKICPIGVIVPSLINGTVKNSSSNTTLNWGETLPVAGFRTIATDPAWNGELPIYIPAHDLGYYLGIPDMFPFNILSKI